MAVAYIYYGKPINVDTATAFMAGIRTLIGEHREMLPNGIPNYLWDTIRVSIASGGGDIVAGFALYNEIIGIDATVHTHNASAADSAALLPFLAGERRSASKYSGFLMHQMSWNFPTAAQTRTQIADVTGWMKNYDKMMAELIAEKTKLSFDEAQRMMRDGTNLTPQEALEVGIIHTIEDCFTPKEARSWQV